MVSDEGREYRRRKGRHFLIPAGVLIGLGLGILLNYPGPGVLIGLGLGFLGSAFQKPEESTPQDATSPNFMHRSQLTYTILGIFMIIIGIGIVWAPPNLWPVIAAIFLILLGVWFILRGYFRSK
jgi:hypothetical protein